MIESGKATTWRVGAFMVLLAAFFISLSNVLAPILYEAGSNPLTYLTLGFLGFVVFCRIWFWVRPADPTPAARLW